MFNGYIQDTASEASDGSFANNDQDEDYVPPKRTKGHHRKSDKDDGETHTPSRRCTPSAKKAKKLVSDTIKKNTSVTTKGPGPLPAQENVSAMGR